jgi:hypothetical protein
MDPITIGLAFSAAQSAVSHIKQAIALGKDVNSLIGQFSKFFESSDAIHRARNKVQSKASRLGKTDAELGREALEIAMHSDALRQAEQDLKKMIIWNLGKPEVWEQMIKERTRLFKERALAEAEETNRQIQKKKETADRMVFAMVFLSVSAVIFCFVFAGIGIYGAIEEQKIYQQKVADRNALLRRQAKEREARERIERDKAIAGG